MSGLLYTIIITIIAVLAAIGGLLLIRRFVPVSSMEKHNDVAGFVYAVVGVVYAVLLAFVVDTVWEMHREAESYVHNEAKRIRDIYLDADGLPADMKQSLRAEIKNYVKLVAANEWESMTQTGFSKEAEQSFLRIRKLFRDYRPRDNYESTWYNRAIESLDKFGEYRNMRIMAGRQDIPVIMWLVLIFGGILTIGFSYLFGTKNAWAQIIMVAVLTAMITSILILIWGLESPFSGFIRVEADAFKLLAEELAAI